MVQFTFYMSNKNISNVFLIDKYISNKLYKLCFYMGEERTNR